MLDLYKSHCPKCRALMPHRIFKMSRLRGTKLQCCACHYIQKRYAKKDLVAWGSESLNKTETSFTSRQGENSPSLSVSIKSEEDSNE